VNCLAATKLLGSGTFGIRCGLCSLTITIGGIMAEESSSVFAFALKYGVIGGALSAVVTLGSFVVGMSESPVGGIAIYVILLVVLIWGQIGYRLSAPPPVEYGEAFVVGFVIILYFVVVGTLYNLIHWNFIDPGIMERTLAAAEAAMRGQGIPEEQMQQAMGVQKMMIGPVATPLIGLVTLTIMGAILCLITSIFIRKKKPAEGA
jgi:hypothetical protein